MRGGILCIEYDDEGSNKTVAHVVRAVANIANVKRSIFTIGTKTELVECLKAKNLKGYSVLYIAMHGLGGLISTDAEPRLTVNNMELAELSEIMGYRFAGFDVHFSTCLTMWNEGDARMFKRNTKARLVSGYKKSIGWDEDTLFLEGVWLSRLVKGRRKMDLAYNRLAKKNGFIVV